MREYQHKLAGIFPDQDAIQQAKQLFLDKGFDEEQIEIIQADEPEEQQETKIEPEPTGVRNEMIRDISIGAGVGGAAGAAGAVGIGLGLPALFVSAPVVAPLMVLGYAAVIGGAAGAIRGFHVKEGVLSAVVEDSLREGFHVLMVYATTKEQAENANQLMQSTMSIDQKKY